MKKLLWISLVLLAFGCKQEEGVEPTDNGEIKVEAHLASRATMTEFEYGDKLGLYAVEYMNGEAQPLQAGGNYLNNEPMMYSQSKWTSDRKIYWSDAACDFYGIYPYQPLKTVENVLFEVATDQNAPETDEALSGYEASDLMWAKAENVSRADGSVKLKFDHMMSRLVVKIVKGPRFEGEIPDDIVTHLYNTATTAKVNFATAALEKYVYSENKTITMRKVDNLTFDAIVVPQFIERTTPLVEITMGGIAYLLNYSMSFRPGYSDSVVVSDL
jgi:hypothetical protein